jgi:hypothetical protein
MNLSRNSRVLVAWLTALLLVLCQTAFAAQACASDLASSGTTTAAAPCHETADTDSNAPARAASGCDAPQVVTDPVKIQLLGILDLRAVSAEELTFSPQIASLATQHVQAVCYSPPFTILHCRFLN